IYPALALYSGRRLVSFLSWIGNLAANPESPSDRARVDRSLHRWDRTSDLFGQLCLQLFDAALCTATLRRSLGGRFDLHGRGKEKRQSAYPWELMSRIGHIRLPLV